MAVAARDGWTCQLCWQPIAGREDLHIDHVVPRSKGGSDDPSNLRATCSACNQARGDNSD